MSVSCTDGKSTRQTEFSAADFGQAAMVVAQFVAALQAIDPVGRSVPSNLAGPTNRGRPGEVTLMSHLCAR